MTPLVAKAVEILDWARPRSRRQGQEFIVVVGQLMIDEGIAAQTLMLNFDFSKKDALKQRRTCFALQVDNTFIDEEGNVGCDAIGARLLKDIEQPQNCCSDEGRWSISRVTAGIPIDASKSFQTFYDRASPSVGSSNWVTDELDDIRAQRELVRQLEKVPPAMTPAKPGRL